jgi:hypothetical protein
MPITTRRLYELFETKWCVMRQNPGGSSPRIKGYLLGFAGVIDISQSVDPVTKTAAVKIKAGNGPVQTGTADFSTAVPAALTVSAAASALNAAGFTGCTFSIDEETGRLKLAPADSGALFIQIYGDLAGALNFGSSRYGEGKGCYLWPSFDGDLKSAAETEQWGEDKVIENESPLGASVKYTKAGNRGGTQIVLTDRLSARAVKQMINGGTWTSGTADKPETYEPPIANDDSARRVDVFTYSEMYSKNDNTEGDAAFIRERIYIGCVGHATRTGGAGSWTDTEYTLTAADWEDNEGKEHASPLENDYTQSQFEALQLSGMLVTDWENA